jgi:hypothetical protein
LIAETAADRADDSKRAKMTGRVAQSSLLSIGQSQYAPQSGAAEERLLVLLFGLPRSGTTWVGKIFDSHPRTLYKHEPDTFPLAPAMPWSPDVEETEVLRPAALHFLNLLPNVNTGRAAGSLPVFRKEYRSEWQSWMHFGSILGTKLVRRAFTKELPVLPCCDYDSVAGLRLVWKSVSSLGRLGVFLRVASHRKAIIIIRHPCGVIASLQRGRSMGYLRNDQSEDYPLFEMLVRTDPGKRHRLTISKLQQMRPEERLAWKWVMVHEKALEEVGDHDDVRFVRYEDICDDPPAATVKMFDFCGLPWSVQTEKFLRTSTKPRSNHIEFDGERWLQTRREYFAIRKNPVQAATGWRAELQRDEIGRICAILQCSSLARLYPAT